MENGLHYSKCERFVESVTCTPIGNKIPLCDDFRHICISVKSIFYHRICRHCIAAKIIDINYRNQVLVSVNLF